MCLTCRSRKETTLASPKRNINHQEPVQRKAYYTTLSGGAKTCAYTSVQTSKKYSHLVASGNRINIWLATKLAECYSECLPRVLTVLGTRSHYSSGPLTFHFLLLFCACPADVYVKEHEDRNKLILSARRRRQPQKGAST